MEGHVRHRREMEEVTRTGRLYPEKMLFSSRCLRYLITCVCVCRIADPDQPVLWLDQMPERSLSRGFNNHINLIRCRNTHDRSDTLSLLDQVQPVLGGFLVLRFTIISGPEISSAHKPGIAQIRYPVLVSGRSHVRCLEKLYSGTFYHVDLVSSYPPSLHFCKSVLCGNVM